MAKRIVLLLVAVCLLAGGCGVIRESRKTVQKVPASVLDLSGLEYKGRVEKSAVYFYNETSGTLTAELRTLVIDQDTNPAKAAIEQLLAGPSSESLKNVAPEGMMLDYIEFSKDAANVYLLYDGTMQQKQAYTLELAIANTVTDILGASSIYVFYNGVRQGFMGYPSAPLRKQTGSIEEAWLNAYARYVPETQLLTDEEEQEEKDEENGEPPRPKITEMGTVLYFVAAGGSYILPEVRSVRFTDGNYIEGIIEELKKGPQDTAIMESPFTAGLSFSQPPEYELLADQSIRLRLFFDSLPVKSDFAHPQETELSYAALIYTLTGFLPGVSSLEVYADGLPAMNVNAADGILIRNDFVGYIGSSAPLYFADRNSDLLLEIPRTMEQQRIWSAKARVFELLRGPLSQDGDNVWPVIPAGVGEDDILFVDVYNDTAYINLSQRFKDACKNLSARNEMLLVYSMVNTLTAMKGLSKVQFLVEGKQAETLSGHLCLTDPFLRNFGIIKQR